MERLFTMRWLAWGIRSFATRRAKKFVDICIFRFDRAELERELEAAVRRGVKVRALIAHTNRGGENHGTRAYAAFVARPYAAVIRATT